MESPNKEKLKLTSLFEVPEEKSELIGVEIELSTVDIKSGKTVPYDGPQGVRNLLEHFVEGGLGKHYLNNNYLMGVDLNDGGYLRLEHGGAIEYCSPATGSFKDIIDRTKSVLKHIAQIADECGVALLSTGLTPFSGINEIQWMPKPYSQYMQRYFSDIGELGVGGPGIMAHSNSVQTTLDYKDEQDMLDKVHCAALLTPLCVGLFANSPLEGGRLTGSLSRRTELWFTTDPDRCGIIPATINKDVSAEDIAHWMSDRKMIYYSKQGAYTYGEMRSFTEAVQNGFSDGRTPTMQDWLIHIGQLWPDVRVRQTIELRAPDEPPSNAVNCVPAFWIGLLYDKQSREEIPRLLEQFSLQEHEQARQQAAHIGLNASYPNLSLKTLSREILSLARTGLTRWVNKNNEPASIIDELDPLDEICNTGKTWAEHHIDAWNEGLCQSPEKYIAYHRLPWR